MTLPDYLAALLAAVLGTWLLKYWAPLLPHYREYGRELLDLVRGQEGRG